MDFCGRTIYVQVMRHPDDQEPADLSPGHLPKFVLQHLRPELSMDEREAAIAARPETTGAAVLWLAENGRA